MIEPRHRGHGGENRHSIAQKLRLKVRLSRLDLVERGTKAEFTHHVESEILEPLADVDGASRKRLERTIECFSMR